MKFVRQDPHTNTCGQCCVAMITGVSFANVVRDLGRGKTSAKDLARFLNRQGFKCFPPLQRVGAGWTHNLRTVAPYVTLVRILWERNRSHWVVLYNDEVYDPAGCEPRTDFPGRATSFMPVWKDGSRQFKQYMDMAHWL